MKKTKYKILLLFFAIILVIGGVWAFSNKNFSKNMRVETKNISISNQQTPYQNIDMAP